MHVDVIQEGTLHCFEPGLEDDDGHLVNVEVSAVVYDGDRLLLASDKPIPGEHRSAVFSVSLTEGRPDPDSVSYLTAPAIKQAVKYEDFALSVDGRYIIATTGFDRIDPDSHDLNAYNHLLVWPVGAPEQVRVVDPDPRNDVEGSLELRRKLDAAIGTPYYKIEGLAAIPGNVGDGTLLFGVREQGQTHDEFDYVARVVGAPYRIDEQGVMTFVDDLVSWYAFDAGTFDEVRFVCGLSSLEYDPYNERMYLLTSFEVEDEAQSRIGGYLWCLSMDEFHAGKAPTLCRTRDGQVLEFEHKAEGLAVLDSTTLFVAYDNDREMGLGSILDRDERYASEAPYTLLKCVQGDPRQPLSVS